MEALPSDLKKIAVLCILLLINFGVVFSENADILNTRTAATIDAVQVRIEVTDVNDNPPVFLKHKYEVAVRTKLAPLSTVLQLQAMDKDSGANAELSFKIESGSEGFFDINSKGAIVSTRNLDQENLRLFNMTVSVSDQGQPPLTAERPAQVSLLVFQPFQIPVYFLKATYTTVRVQFNLKFLNKRNVAKYGIIVQRSKPGDSKFAEYSELEALTWYQVKEDAQSMRRYITAIVPSSADIERKGMLDIVIGTENCNDMKDKDGYCNGPLTPGHRYRFQLRAYVKNTGPFTELSFKDSTFARCLVEMPSSAAGRRIR